MFRNTLLFMAGIVLFTGCVVVRPVEKTNPQQMNTVKSEGPKTNAVKVKEPIKKEVVISDDAYMFLEKGALAMQYGQWKTARISLEKACNGNLARGCYNVGALYDSADYGMKRDAKKAAQYFTKACDLDYADACDNLGLMYTDGDGVKKNIAKAKEMHYKSCQLGSQDACQSYQALNRKK